MTTPTVTIAALLTTAVLWSPMAHAQQASEQRSFYDKSGSFAGSSTTYNGGKSMSAYDRNGRFDGSAIRNSDGTVSLYDRSGHFTGSSSRTTQPSSWR